MFSKNDQKVSFRAGDITEYKSVGFKAVLIYRLYTICGVFNAAPGTALS